MKQAAAWTVAGVCAIAALGIHVQSGNVIAAKDAEIQALKRSHEKLVDEANARLQAASLPQVPVTVSFRKAMLGSGSVAMIKNVSSRSIALTVTASRPAANEERSFQQVLDGQQSAEIGHGEGWAFVSGDQVQVSIPDHKPLRYTYK